MNDDRVRTAVAQYVTGSISAGEAARRADISRAELRHYARTVGTVVLSSDAASDAASDTATEESDTEPA